MKTTKNTISGFTLVELLVVVAISGVVGAAIIGFFIAQQRSHTAQEQVTFMQQNIRAGLGIMTKELRMAAYDPARAGGFDFSALGLNQLTFQMDLNGDGDAADSGEQIKYYLGGSNGDTLLRLSQGNPVPQPLADAIAAIAFAFAYDSDDDGDLEIDAGSNIIYAIAGDDGLGPLDGSVNWYNVNADGSTSDTGTLAFAQDIRAVKIWLLAQTAPAQNYQNTNTYIVGTETINSNDNRRRMLLQTVVNCRNMGI